VDGLTHRPVRCRVRGTRACACLPWVVQNVLKGIFPVMVGGACCHYAFIFYKMYWTRKFVNPPPHIPLRKIFKFEYPGGLLSISQGTV